MLRELGFRHTIKFCTRFVELSDTQSYKHGFVEALECFPSWGTLVILFGSCHIGGVNFIIIHEGRKFVFCQREDQVIVIPKPALLDSLIEERDQD